jgi:hypothetical protein
MGLPPAKINLKKAILRKITVAMIYYVLSPHPQSPETMYLFGFLNKPRLAEASSLSMLIT